MYRLASVAALLCASAVAEPVGIDVLYSDIPQAATRQLRDETFQAISGRVADAFEELGVGETVDRFLADVEQMEFLTSLAVIGEGIDTIVDAIDTFADETLDFAGARRSALDAAQRLSGVCSIPDNSLTGRRLASVFVDDSPVADLFPNNELPDVSDYFGLSFELFPNAGGFGGFYWIMTIGFGDFSMDLYFASSNPQCWSSGSTIFGDQIAGAAIDMKWVYATVKSIAGSTAGIRDVSFAQIKTALLSLSFPNSIKVGLKFAFTAGDTFSGDLDFSCSPPSPVEWTTPLAVLTPSLSYEKQTQGNLAVGFTTGPGVSVGVGKEVPGIFVGVTFGFGAFVNYTRPGPSARRLRQTTSSFADINSSFGTTVTPPTTQSQWDDIFNPIVDAVETLASGSLQYEFCSGDCSDPATAAVSGSASIILRDNCEVFAQVNVQNATLGAISPDVPSWLAGIGFSDVTLSGLARPSPISLNVVLDAGLNIVGAQDDDFLQILADIANGLRGQVIIDKDTKSLQVELKVGTDPVNLGNNVWLRSIDGTIGPNYFVRYEKYKLPGTENVDSGSGAESEATPSFQGTSTGMEVPLEVCVEGCGTEQNVTLIFEGELYTEKTETSTTINGDLTFTGDWWSNVAGFPLFHVGNLVLGLGADFSAAIPVPTRILAGGQFCLGREENCVDTGAAYVEDASVIKGGAYVEFSATNPADNYFAAMLEELTIETILDVAIMYTELAEDVADAVGDAVGGDAGDAVGVVADVAGVATDALTFLRDNMPGPLLESGILPYNEACDIDTNATAAGDYSNVEAGCYAWLSYSPLINKRLKFKDNDIVIKQGFGAQGRLNLLGWEMSVDMAVSSSKVFLNATMDKAELTIGGVEVLKFGGAIVNKKMVGDANFLVDVRTKKPQMVEVNFTGALEIPILQSYGQMNGYLNSEGVSFNAEINLFGGAFNPRVSASMGFDLQHIHFELGDFPFLGRLVVLENVLFDYNATNGNAIKFQSKVTCLFIASLETEVNFQNDFHDIDFRVEVDAWVAKAIVTGSASYLPGDDFLDADFDLSVSFEWTDVAAAIAEAVSAAAEAVAEAVVEVWNDATAAIANLVGDIAEALEAVFDGVVEFFNDLGSDISDAVNFIGDGFDEAFEALDSAVDSAVSFAEDGWNAAADVAEDVYDNTIGKVVDLFRRRRLLNSGLTVKDGKTQQDVDNALASVKAIETRLNNTQKALVESKGGSEGIQSILDNGASISPQMTTTNTPSATPGLQAVTIGGSVPVLPANSSQTETQAPVTKSGPVDFSSLEALNATLGNLRDGLTSDMADTALSQQTSLTEDILAATGRADLAEPVLQAQLTPFSYTCTSFKSYRTVANSVGRPTASQYTVDPHCASGVAFQFSNPYWINPEDFLADQTKTCGSGFKERTVTLTDGCGQSTNPPATQLITVEPAQALFSEEDFPQTANVTTYESIDPALTGQPTGVSPCGTPFEITFEDLAPVQTACGIWTIERIWSIDIVVDEACMGIRLAPVTRSQTIIVRDVNAPEYIQLPADTTSVPFLTNYGSGVTGVPLVEDKAAPDIAALGLVSYPIELTFADSLPAFLDDDCNAVVEFTRTWTTTDGCGNTQSWEQLVSILDPREAADGLLGEASGYMVFGSQGGVDISESAISGAVGAPQVDGTQAGKIVSLSGLSNSLTSTCAGQAFEPLLTELEVVRPSWEALSGDCAGGILGDRTSQDTVEECQDLCFGDVECKGISFSASNGRCYKKSVSGCADVDSSSAYVFFAKPADKPAAPFFKHAMMRIGNFSSALVSLGRMHSIQDETLSHGLRTVQCTSKDQASCLPTEVTMAPSSTVLRDDQAEIELHGTGEIYNFFELEMEDVFAKGQVDPSLLVKASGFVFVNIELTEFGTSDSTFRNFKCDPLARGCKAERILTNIALPRDGVSSGLVQEKAWYRTVCESGECDFTGSGCRDVGLEYVTKLSECREASLEVYEKYTNLCSNAFITEGGSNDDIDHLNGPYGCSGMGPSSSKPRGCSLRVKNERTYVNEHHTGGSATGEYWGYKAICRFDLSFQNSDIRTNIIVNEPELEINIRDSSMAGSQIWSTGTHISLTDSTQDCGLHAANTACGL